MSEKDINFLPKDMQPKKPVVTHKNDEVSFSEPDAFNQITADDNRYVAKNKADKSSFSSSKKKNSQTGDFSRDRQNILSNIKNKKSKNITYPPPAPVHNIAKDSTPVASFFKNFLAAALGGRTAKTGQAASARPVINSDGDLQTKDTQSSAVMLKHKTINMPSTGSPKFSLKKSTPASATEQVMPLSDNRPLIGTNLIHGQEFVFFDWRKAITVNLLTVLLSAVIIIVVWGALEIFNKKQTDNIHPLQTNLAVKEQKINDLTAEVAKFSALRDKVIMVRDILKNHIYWTNFFNFLEENTLADVYYESFKGDLSGTYDLTGTAKDFSTLTAQMKLWQNEKKYTNQTTVSDMKNTYMTIGEESTQIVQFNINLNINKEVFYK